MGRIVFFVIIKNCLKCKKDFKVKNYREKTAKFCSYFCKAQYEWLQPERKIIARQRMLGKKLSQQTKLRMKKSAHRGKEHSAGSKHATFSITRWFYADATQENLLLDLFLNETEFTLKGDLINNAGTPIATTEVSLSNCRLYKWRPRTGAADDIIGEEAQGEAIDWTSSVVHT